MIELTATCLEVPLFTFSPYQGKSQRLRQRSVKRQLVFTVANAALEALNSLSAGSREVTDHYAIFQDSSLEASQRNSVFTSSAFSASSKSRAKDFIPRVFKASNSCLNEQQQQRVRQFVLSASALFVNRVALDCGDDHLDERHLFSYMHKQQAVELVADRVALPDTAGTIDLVAMLPANVAAMISSPSPDLLRSLTHSSPQVSSRISSDPEYIKLLRRMKSAGMLSFTRAPKCVNNFFCVAKDEQSLRFIVNAKPSNLLFNSPPHTSLPNPELLASLILDQAAQLFIAKVDISNFYHNLRLPDWLHDYFALPAVDPKELGLPSMSQHDSIFPCCSTLPMGWSWSVFLAQSAHENFLTARTRLRSADMLTHANDFLLNRPRHSLYIDDLAILATDPNVCRKLQDDYIAACDSFGLPVKASKVLHPTTQAEVIGVEMDGVQHTVGVTARKLASLIERTNALLYRGCASGDEIERLIGAWSWAFLVRRPAFSCFSAVYRYVRIAGASTFTLWPSVRKELLLACGLAPLLRVCLSAPCLPRLIAADASSTGQGVVMSRVSESLSASLGCTLPLSPLQPLSERDSQSLLAQTWSTIISSPWQSDEHINCRELRAAKAAVLWASSLPSALSSKVLLLSDSSVAVAVLSKGRSSSFQILRIAQQLASIALSFNIQLMARWVPSQFNPSDQASRAFE
jgi:hypothetical protein